jgi:hypothetical protein
MARKKMVYPKFLRDIPSWRRRELTRDILWFSRYSPCERLKWADREWNEIQSYIKKFGLQSHGTRKRS